MELRPRRSCRDSRNGNDPEQPEVSEAVSAPEPAQHLQTHFFSFLRSRAVSAAHFKLTKSLNFADWQTGSTKPPSRRSPPPAPSTARSTPRRWWLRSCSARPRSEFTLSSVSLNIGSNAWRPTRSRRVFLSTPRPRPHRFARLHRGHSHRTPELPRGNEPRRRARVRGGRHRLGVHLRSA